MRSAEGALHPSTQSQAATRRPAPAAPMRTAVESAATSTAAAASAAAAASGLGPPPPHLMHQQCAGVGKRSLPSEDDDGDAGATRARIRLWREACVSVCAICAQAPRSHAFVPATPSVRRSVAIYASLQRRVAPCCILRREPIGTADMRRTTRSRRHAARNQRRYSVETRSARERVAASDGTHVSIRCGCSISMLPVCQAEWTDHQQAAAAVVAEQPGSCSQ